METIGSLIDKMSINELKIYHMQEQIERNDISDEFLKECKMRISILKSQRGDLILELQELMNDVSSGKRQLKLYRQMKMYNEKKFKD